MAVINRKVKPQVAKVEKKKCTVLHEPLIKLHIEAAGSKRDEVLKAYEYIDSICGFKSGTTKNYHGYVMSGKKKLMDEQRRAKGILVRGEKTAQTNLFEGEMTPTVVDVAKEARPLFNVMRMGIDYLTTPEKVEMLGVINRSM